MHAALVFWSLARGLYICLVDMSRSIIPERSACRSCTSMGAAGPLSVSLTLAFVSRGCLGTTLHTVGGLSPLRQKVNYYHGAPYVRRATIL